MKTLAVFATAVILVVSNAILLHPVRRLHLEGHNRKHLPSAIVSSNDQHKEVHNMPEHGMKHRPVLPLLTRWHVPDRVFRTLYRVRIYEDGTNKRRWFTTDKHKNTHNMETSAADHSHRRVSGVKEAANSDSNVSKKDPKAGADPVDGEELDRRRRDLTGEAETVSLNAVDYSA